jgi:hypothetical protein
VALYYALQPFLDFGDTFALLAVRRGLRWPLRAFWNSGTVGGRKDAPE